PRQASGTRGPGTGEARSPGSAPAVVQDLINAFYGYLAFSGGHWNDFDAADRVTAEGRAVVTAILAALEKLGAVPVEADTDGVYFVPPPGHSPDDAEPLLELLTVGMPAGIHREHPL